MRDALDPAATRAKSHRHSATITRNDRRDSIPRRGSRAKPQRPEGRSRIPHDLPVTGLSKRPSVWLIGRPLRDDLQSARREVSNRQRAKLLHRLRGDRGAARAPVVCAVTSATARRRDAWEPRADRQNAIAGEGEQSCVGDDDERPGPPVCDSTVNRSSCGTGFTRITRAEGGGWTDEIVTRPPRARRRPRDDCPYRRMRARSRAHPNLVEPKYRRGAGCRKARCTRACRVGAHGCLQRDGTVVRRVFVRRAWRVRAGYAAPLAMAEEPFRP